MKVLKTFIKPFEAPQRSVEMKSFASIQLWEFHPNSLNLFRSNTLHYYALPYLQHMQSNREHKHEMSPVTYRLFCSKLFQAPVILIRFDSMSVSIFLLTNRWTMICLINSTLILSNTVEVDGRLQTTDTRLWMKLRTSSHVCSWLNVKTISCDFRRNYYGVIYCRDSVFWNLVKFFN